MDPKKEIRKKLDELYWKNEEVKKDLIALHNLLQQSNFFSETPAVQQTFHPPVQQPVAPPQTFVPPVANPVVPPVVNPVTPPVAPPVKMPWEKTAEERKPQPQLVQQPPPPRQFVPPPPPPKPAQPGFFERHPDLEKLIGERLLTFIGVVVLVIGIAFFVKFAIDKNWINETGRTAIGILCGGVLLGFAHRLRKNFAGFSSVLVGGGIAVLYFTISYAFQVYQLFPQAVAFGLLVVITGFTILLSLSYDRKELAIFAIVGGFASPLMVSTGQGNLPVLSTYMLILDIGMLVLAYYKKWNIVNILSYVFTVFLFGGALYREVQLGDKANYVTALVFATLFYFTFFMMNVVNNVRLKNKFSAFEIITLLSNTFLYYGCGYFILKQMDASLYQGLFTLLVAVFNFVFAFLLLRRQEVDRNLFYFLVGLVITFVSLAGPVQLNGNHITLFWAAEGTLLFWLHQRSRIQLIRYFSVIITCITLLSLLYNWINVYIDAKEGMPVMDILLNKGFITGIVVVISLVITSYLLSKEKTENTNEEWSGEVFHKLLNIMAVALLFFGGMLELHYQLSFVRHANGNELAIYLSSYTSLFVLAMWFVIRPLKLEYMDMTVMLIGVVLMIAYGGMPHYFTIHQRDHYLIYDAAGKTAFLFHYVHAAAVIALSFLLLDRVRKAKNLEQQLKDAYLWLMCFVLVFIVSAELDHTIIINGFTPVKDLAATPWLGEEEIKALATQSHKIGFPILWGLSSFLMIVIGMRKRIRQLRIIALVLFAVTIIKLILLGIYGESQTGKIVAFILSGVILLLVSFMYQKLKKIILEEDQPKEKTESHEQA